MEAIFAITFLITSTVAAFRASYVRQLMVVHDCLLKFVQIRCFLCVFLPVGVLNNAHEGKFGLGSPELKFLLNEQAYGRLIELLQSLRVSHVIADIFISYGFDLADLLLYSLQKNSFDLIFSNAELSYHLLLKFLEAMNVGFLGLSQVLDRKLALFTDSAPFFGFKDVDVGVEELFPLSQR